MRKIIRFTIFLSVLSGVAACTTHLTARRVEYAESQHAGYPYRLKFTQYEIALTRRIVRCGDVPERGKDLDNPVDIQITAAFKEKVAFDPAEFYIIDPRDLADLFKTTDAKFEWHEDRSLKSVNVTVQDHTAQVISNVVAGVGKIASMGFAGAGAGNCSNAVMLALKDIPPAKAKVENAQKSLDDATAGLALVVAKVAAMGTAVDNATKRLLAKRMRQVEAATALLSAQKKILERHLKVVSYVKKVTWPTQARERATTVPDEVPEDVLERWGVSTSNETAPRLKVYFGLTVVGVDASGKPPSNDDGLPEAVEGLPYREPVMSRLSVCTNNPCGKAGADVVAANEGLVLQTGPLLVLPFEGRTFASMTASAGFDKSGMLQSAGFAQTAAPAVGASEAFKAVAEQAAGTFEAARGARTKALQAELAELNAEKALAEARAAPNPDQAVIKDFEIQAALAKAELAAIQAQQALAQARSAAPP